MLLRMPPQGAQNFMIKATDGNARVAQLVTKHGTINTPATFIYTRRGGPLAMTPDMLEKLKPQPSGFQVDVLQL